jgi:hypothetical protein
MRIEFVKEARQEKIKAEIRQREAEQAEKYRLELEQNVEYQSWLAYLQREREFQTQQRIERERLTEKMSADEITVNSYTELVHLPKERSRNLHLAQVLIRPILHEFYDATVIEIQKEDEVGEIKVIRCKGPCFAKDVIWTYEPHQISMRIAVPNEKEYTLYLQDKQIAEYFWTLWHDELPPFNNYVFDACYFILSLYTTWKRDPYYFRGVHSIYGHEWIQYNNDGNEILINGGYCFVYQRRLLYAGIRWWQKHVYTATIKYIRNELLLPVLGDIVWSYYENVKYDYVTVDNILIKSNPYLTRRDAFSY